MVSESGKSLIRKIERSQLFKDMKESLEQVLVFAYGRATKQQKEPEQYALRGDFSPQHGSDLALIALEAIGFIERDANGIYVTSPEGRKYVEEMYGGIEGWGVKIARPNYPPPYAPDETLAHLEKELMEKPKELDRPITIGDPDDFDTKLLP